MHLFSLSLFFAFLASLISTITSSSDSSTCTAQRRLQAARAIPHAYNLSPLGASSAAFDQVPFAKDCQTSM